MRKFYIIVIALLLLTACSPQTPAPDGETPDTAVQTPDTVTTTEVSPPQEENPSAEINEEIDNATAEMKADAALEAVEQTFDALKSADAAEIEKYMPQALLDNPKLASEAFKRLEWTMGEMQEAQDGYEAACLITTVNTVDAVNQYVLESYRMTAENAALPAGERLSDGQINERLEDMFATAIRATDTLMSVMVTLKIERQGEEWRIVPDEEVTAALTGNLGEAMKQADFPPK